MAAEEDPEEAARGYASPACSMHEVDPAYMGIAPPGGSAADVVEWRRGERKRLIEARSALPFTQRAEFTSAISANLDRLIGDVAGKRISLYWPFLSEPDLRGWMGSVTGRGGTTLLPVVVAKKTPLTFRSWQMGEKLERGVWNILFPAEGEEAVPDIVIAPVVGFDPWCFRLGYGGGFFDRTLAALKRPQLIVGVGYASQFIATIRPQPHDIPMDVIVTEEGISRRRPDL